MTKKKKTDGGGIFMLIIFGALALYLYSLAGK